MISDIIRQAKMYGKTVKCGSCNSLINISNGYNIYRTCDRYVCSPRCSNMLLSNITHDDPKLQKPTTWYNARNRLYHPMKKTQSFSNVTDYNYPPELTFGVEIETDIERNLEPIKEEPNDNNRWKVNSVIGILCGIAVYAFCVL